VARDFSSTISWKKHNQSINQSNEMNDCEMVDDETDYEMVVNETDKDD